MLTPIEPPLDRRQSATALSVQRGTARLLRQLGFAVLSEVTLASNRRADLMALGGDGLVWIIEIKSSFEDFRVDQKWPEYREYCDRFSFAIPIDLAPEIFPESAGLIVADQYGADIMRQTPDHPLHGSRRKAVTLLFGRVGAQRLHGLYDP